MFTVIESSLTNVFVLLFLLNVCQMKGNVIFFSPKTPGADQAAKPGAET